MDSLIDTIVDFVRVRQLNIAEEKPDNTSYYRAGLIGVAVLLTTIYLVYQYWETITKGGSQQDIRPSRSRSRSKNRSRSRSRSRSYYNKQSDSNSKVRRGRKHRRCPDCSLCEFDH